MNDDEARRKDDERIEKLIAEQTAIRSHVMALRNELRANTEVTNQVRDLLATFRVAGAVAKWLTGIFGAGVTIWHIIKPLLPK